MALPYVDLFHRWDYAWQLWGVAGRISQSVRALPGMLHRYSSCVQMGLHRDGSQWALDNKDVDMRRRVFWYIHMGDIFMVSEI